MSILMIKVSEKDSKELYSHQFFIFVRYVFEIYYERRT